MPRRAYAPGVARSLDAFVTKTITPLPREGNPPVRIVETDHGMLNSIGLQGPGIDRFVTDVLPLLVALELELWVSVGGFSEEDFRIVCERLDGEASIATIELNLSCPNVDEAPEAAAELVAAARGATSKPLYAKLSPAQWDLATAAKAVAAAGADGLSLVNTLRGLAVDPQSGAPALARGLGGYPVRRSGRSRSRRCSHARTRRACRSSAWAASRPASTSATSSRSAPRRSRSGRSCSPIRTLRHAFGAS